MAKKNETVEATVVDAKSTEIPVVQKTPVQVIEEQRATFKAQLDQAKANMTKLQQQFEAQKILATKLEGAQESLDLLLKSLQK